MSRRKRLLSIGLTVALLFAGTALTPKAEAAFVTTPKVEIGFNNTIALKSDGTVWAWGDNASSKLGDGTTTDRVVPQQVSGLTNIKDIAAGSNHVLVLKEDGTVWAWGSNSAGQLGDGTKTSRKVPVQVSGLSSVKAIYAGEGNSSFAIKNDGTLWVWGSDSYDRLGLGGTGSRTLPTMVTGISNVKSLSIGMKNVVAETSLGTYWTWGNNGSFQIGNGVTTSQKTPLQIAGLTDVVSYSSGDMNAMFVKTDGSVLNLGDGFTNGVSSPRGVDYKVPTLVPTISNGKLVTTHAQRAFVVKDDGTLWGFGYNISGGLGRGHSAVNSDQYVPQQVVKDLASTPLTDVIYVTSGQNHSAAITSDGTVWSWGGTNATGAMGDGTKVAKHYAVPAVGLNLLSDQAESIQLNETKYISLGQGETKRFQFIPAQSGMVTITTGPWQFPTDPVITLLDQNNTILAVDDDSGPDLEALITYYVIAGQKYYIEINGYIGGQVNGTLTVTM
ncbi:RCC1 domain-containing protein [Paenibacillus xylaniclasticus]|uniref:RCC1 domain-containing protein n=1 Tax=Paenibacillus xylaniclasticus TaxID=588083 RepID=UPI0013E088ED|nr:MULTISPECIES: RCC1 domain-containing protein [Paenibacillus]GFN31893.1 hypothetical protein PCURB6_21530 [Paenibacillus curdlanolyticus]